jgi:Ca-activated chloride channel family protein
MSTVEGWYDSALHSVRQVQFASPLVLLILFALPLALVLYAIHERRQGRTIARFANPALLPNLLPRRASWRRHVAPVILLLALAALVCGAARPQRQTTVPRRQATVVLVIDSSRSMSATDVKPTRLAAARAAARTLVAALPDDGRVGVVAFTRIPQTLNAPTDDRTVIDGSLRSLTVGGGTAVGDAIVRALGLVAQSQKGVQAPAGGRAPAAIVLLSDGSSTEGHVGPLAAARRAKASHVPVYTVSLGTSSGTVVDPGTGKTLPVPPDPASLGAIARAAGGKTYTASTASHLKDVYGRIGRQVGTQVQDQDLSRFFIGGGIALVALAMLASARWFRTLA